VPKEELTLTFGSKTGDRFEFTLASIDEYGFVAGAIRLTAGGRSVVLDDRNGIEAMALTHLRRDVQQLLQQDGNLDFGDHDYARMVEVERRGGVVRAHADLPSEDLWEIPLGDMSDDDLRRLVEVVTAAEERFGPLTGYCAGCGVPQPTWRA
jgi:hypothetical protein